MQVLNISNSNNTSFGANILETSALSKYVKHFKAEKHSSRFSDSIKAAQLLKDFPSDAEIKIIAYTRQNFPLSVYGAIESQYAKYIDTEPSNKNSVPPVYNILRRILSPDSKVQLAKLMGCKDTAFVEKWWNENVKPLWDKYLKKPNNEHLEGSYANWFKLQDGSGKLA